MFERTVVAIVAGILGFSVISAFAKPLDPHYAEVIAFNGRLHATLTQTLRRCPGVRKVAKYSVDSLRNVYDPGEELKLFDQSSAEVLTMWGRATREVLTALCLQSLRDNGPAGSNWIVGP